MPNDLPRVVTFTKEQIESILKDHVKMLYPGCTPNQIYFFKNGPEGGYVTTQHFNTASIYLDK